jgi:hypothetical protein
MRKIIATVACAPPLLMLLYVLSAGPVIRYSFGSNSSPRIYEIYGPVLALDQAKPPGRAFWAYMRLWHVYPGGAF